MKKILVISWFYPPINSSEGLVTFKLLNNSQFEYDVFTQKNVTSWSYGDNMEFKNQANVRSVFAKSKDISIWKEEAFQYFRENRDQYDCVMTRSMPQESHEVGIRIKKEFPEVKWIASFGDPVKNNPYQHIDCSLFCYFSLKNKINHDKGLSFKLSPKRILKTVYWDLRHRFSLKFRKQLADIEDTTMALADKIIFNNESQQKYMSPSQDILDKSVVIRHSYDESMYDNLKSAGRPDGDRKLRFVFIGQLNCIRTAYPLLSAIKELKESMDDLPQRAEFVFYGDMSDGDLVYIMRNSLLDVVRVEKPISYLESLQAMVDADWLINIDGNIGLVTDENIFFAGKIADYFGAGRSIMSISMQKGDVNEVLRKAGELVLSFSANEIKQYLYLIIYQGYEVHPDREYIRTFESKNVAKAFDEKVIGELYGR